MKYIFSGLLKVLVEKANSGFAGDVDYIMSYLHQDATIAETRFVDYSLGLVINPEGVERIRYYLFNGSLIQRNYASLFFNRRGGWLYVKQAFEQGLIDEIQAFAR